MLLCLQCLQPKEQALREEAERDEVGHLIIQLRHLAAGNALKTQAAPELYHVVRQSGIVLQMFKGMTSDLATFVFLRPR